MLQGTLFRRHYLTYKKKRKREGGRKGREGKGRERKNRKRKAAYSNFTLGRVTRHSSILKVLQ